MQSPGAEDHAEHQEVAEQGHEDDEAVHAHDQVVLHLELLLQQGDSLGKVFTLRCSPQIVYKICQGECLLNHLYSSLENAMRHF